MARVRRLSTETDWDEVSLVLTDDEEIERLNGIHLGIRESTDVLSFRYEPMPGGSSLYSAEIIVNVQRAFQVANRISWSPEKELALYIAHGCDHLTSADDHDSAGTRHMRRRELRWLKDAGCAGIISGLIL